MLGDGRRSRLAALSLLLRNLHLRCISPVEKHKKTGTRTSTLSGVIGGDFPLQEVVVKEDHHAAQNRKGDDECCWIPADRFSEYEVVSQSDLSHLQVRGREEIPFVKHGVLDRVYHVVRARRDDTVDGMSFWNM